MCVIIAKNKNDRLPSIEELKNCFSNNSDGAGFMYVLKHNVIIDKGYMEEDKFLKRFEYLCKRFDNFKNKSLVIHCRIGTAGTNTAQNTHPYPISNRVEDLHKLYYRCNLGIAHNGIITSYNPTANDKNDINDTQNFIIKYLSDLATNYKHFYKNNNMLDAIQKISNSKFALLDTKDNLITIGAFTTHDGLLFSNTSYEKKTYTYKYSSYDYYNDWWNKHSWNNEKKCFEKTTNKLTTYTHIPTSYFLFYNNDIFSGSDYYINEDGDLLKHSNNKYNYITSDFIMYDKDWTEVTTEELLEATL